MRGGGPGPRRAPERTASFEARREHDLLEQIGGDLPGAGAGQQPSPGRDETHRQAVDVLVRARRPIDVSSLLREGRRVAHDDVPLLASLDAAPHVLENIGAHEVRLIY